jgi:hypothetical protein
MPTSRQCPGMCLLKAAAIHCLPPGSVQACAYWKPQLNCPLRSLSILPTVRSALLKVGPHVYIDNCFFDFPRTSLRTQQLSLIVNCLLDSKSCLTENTQLLRLGSQLFLRLHLVNHSEHNLSQFFRPQTVSSAPGRTSERTLSRFVSYFFGFTSLSPKEHISASFLDQLFFGLNSHLRENPGGMFLSSAVSSASVRTSHNVCGIPAGYINTRKSAS